MNNATAPVLVRISGILFACLIVFAWSTLHRTFEIRLIPFGLIFAGISFGFIAGLVINAGYYFVCIALNYRLTKFMVYELMVVALLGYFAIYYLDYYLGIFQNGTHYNEFMSFSTYMHIAIIKAPLHMGTGIFTAQAILVLLGALTLYDYLRSKPYCPKCHRYLTKIASREVIFSNVDEFNQYDPTIAKQPPKSNALNKEDSIRAIETLYQCSHCNIQSVESKYMVYKQNKWRFDYSLRKKVTALPAGVNLLPYFKELLK